MKNVRFLLVVLLVGALALTISVPAWGQGTIKIGVIGPMQFVQGKGHWNGAVMAMEAINAAGGVKVGDKTMKIELVQADSNEFLSVTDATNAMELLMTRHRVDFVVGGFRSEAVLAMQDIAMEYKKIFMGVGAAHPELCTRVVQDYDTYKYWFRVSPFNSSDLARISFLHLMAVGQTMKQQLNIPTLKVAVVAEKAMWADPMVAAAEGVIQKFGMEVAGVWRPSPVATDVTAELSAIQRAGANIIFTIFSSSVGIPFARQAGELKIPAMQVGINVEAQKDGFWEATQGHGNYVITQHTYARNVEQTDKTAPFVNAYVERFGETPTYTADTYGAIRYLIVPAIEKAGSLNADKLVEIIRDMEAKSTTGVIKFAKDQEGRYTHDLTWAPGYAVGLGTQWQDGQMEGVWPNRWKASPEAPEITFKGIVDIKIPPWVVEAYKN